MKLYHWSAVWLAAPAAEPRWRLWDKCCIKKQIGPDAGPTACEEPVVRDKGFAKGRLRENQKNFAPLSCTWRQMRSEAKQRAAGVVLNLQLNLPRGAFTGTPWRWRTSAAWRGGMAKGSSTDLPVFVESCVQPYDEEAGAGRTSPDCPPQRYSDGCRPVLLASDADRGHCSERARLNTCVPRGPLRS